MSAHDRFAGPLAALRAAAFEADPEAAPRFRTAPRLPVPPASDRAAWAAIDQATLRAIEVRALADLGEPWPTPAPHAYARYFRDGDRNTYEQALFARQRRVSRAAIMAAVSPGPQWMDEVVDGTTLLCELSSWCWPAHDDALRVHGSVVPVVTDPFLDLGAGEIAGQLAWLDHLLGAELDAYAPGLRARIRHEVDRRVLTPFEVRRDWHWLGLDGDVHNWNPWIHGNVLVAALQLVDDPARLASLVDLVLEGLDRYVASLPEDGAIDEGYAYWWNGAGRALEALDLVHHATGGAFDHSGVTALRNTVAFPHRMQLGGDWYVNHADGTARVSDPLPWHALHAAARRFGDDGALAHAAAHRVPGGPVATEDQGLGRLLRALTDRAWVGARPSASPLPRDVWLPSTQVLVARTEAGTSTGLTLAAKGGHNAEHHNHNDVGGFVVALGGVPVLVDAGRPTYTRQTFGPDRYAIWTMQSSWHNVPEIRSTAQEPGHAYAARAVTATIGDLGSELTLDLAGAYPRTDVRRWLRTARLDRATGEVSVTDEWELTPDDDAPPTQIRLLAAGDVRAYEDRIEITGLDGSGVVVSTWLPAATPCAATVRVLDDPMLSDVWGERLTRLDFDVTALGPTAAFTLRVAVLSGSSSSGREVR
ncbi:heparinase II/III domain-containing protein [Hamadaea tsunoensis]|uniref:heparinase II/III domain-containing protein n=1 Tax=Hamadaea tsunoensis TaxID=53368 RepID=UPI000429CEED|nr:heparinase II/III family protein [Hamadaea tsunoensis]